MTSKFAHRIARTVAVALFLCGLGCASAAVVPILSYTVSPAPGFADTGGVELKDGILGDPANFNDPPWVAWQNVTPILTFDLGTLATFSEMTIHYMDSTAQAGSTIHCASQRGHQLQHGRRELHQRADLQRHHHFSCAGRQ